jgi:hypothetical protein
MFKILNDKDAVMVLLLIRHQSKVGLKDIAALTKKGEKHAFILISYLVSKEFIVFVNVNEYVLSDRMANVFNRVLNENDEVR